MCPCKSGHLLKMQKHIENYLNYFGYSGLEYIPCEVCKSPAVDVHHVVPRSRFGSKCKHEQDHISNLIGLTLCECCHTSIENKKKDGENLTRLQILIADRWESQPRQIKDGKKIY